MVKMQQHRKAIAMIELIFALVIMGIVLMSAPQLISRASQSNITTFQQESISMIAAHTNALMSYPWDENNVNNATANDRLVANGALSPVILNNSIPRVSRATNAALPASNIGNAPDVAGRFNDVDDFNTNNNALRIYTAAAQATTQGEYIDTQININTTVDYGDDNSAYGPNNFTFNFPAAAAATTHIKRIRTNLTSTRPQGNVMQQNKNIILWAFMCNIGGAVPATGNF